MIARIRESISRCRAQRPRAAGRSHQETWFVAPTPGSKGPGSEAPGPGVYRAGSSRGRAFQRRNARIGRHRDGAATLLIGSRPGPH